MLLNAVANAAPSMGLQPEQRDSQCLVAVRAEENLGPHARPAADYFDQRLAAQGPEVREFLMISAEETILPNTKRREFAATCVLLYQVLKLQEEQGPSTNR